jgi:hypothetical protein
VAVKDSLVKSHFLDDFPAEERRALSPQQRVDKVIRRWMRQLRPSKNLGFFGVRFRGKRPWRAFPTVS